MARRFPFDESDVESEARRDEPGGEGEQRTGDQALDETVMLRNTLGFHGSPHRTIEFICRMGIRIEKATKAITAPIITIIIGSSRAVSAPMRTLTLDS